MQIVINIKENIINDAKNSHIRLDEIANAVLNGTPLPEGHGDLIDRDTLNLDYEVSMADDWNTAHEIANCVKYADVVIPADRVDNMTDREKEMLNEIVQLKLSLLHANVGDGNCQTRIYPLTEHDFKCGNYDDCNTCRAEYYKLAKEEITNDVQRKYGASGST